MKLRKIESLKPKQKKLRVCAYARVSTDSLKQGESFENQVSTYERVIKSNPEYEFVSVYADQGMTGRSENRPEFQRMIADCKAGKIDLIITKSISRFARNTTTVLKYTRELKEIGVGVLFEENNINTLSSEGELMMTVLASFAQEESRSISENNKWTLKKKFERGEGMVNTARFMGYDKDETGDLVINKEEVGDLIDTIEYDYPTFHLSMDCYWCDVVEGELKLLEAESARWLSKEELYDVKWLPADILLIEKIMKNL